MEKKSDAPCKHCTDRTLGCHGVCTVYNEWAIAKKIKHQREKDTKPPVLHKNSFTGAGPKYGKTRRTRRGV